MKQKTILANNNLIKMGGGVTILSGLYGAALCRGLFVIAGGVYGKAGDEAAPEV